MQCVRRSNVSRGTRMVWAGTTNGELPQLAVGHMLGPTVPMIFGNACAYVDLVCSVCLRAAACPRTGFSKRVRFRR